MVEIGAIGSLGRRRDAGLHIAFATDASIHARDRASVLKL
jgi:hypothetical protein